MKRRVPFALLLAASLLILPASVAAAGPQLRASVIPGREIDVVGTGFPASGSVTLVIGRSNHPDETRTLSADAAGSFTTTIDAGPGRGGAYTLVATAGQLSASAAVVAVETAGGGGGTLGSPPPTAARPLPDPGHGPAGATLLVVLAGLLGAGTWLRRSRRAAR